MIYLLEHHCFQLFKNISTLKNHYIKYGKKWWNIHKAAVVKIHEIVMRDTGRKKSLKLGGFLMAAIGKEKQIVFSPLEKGVISKHISLEKVTVNSDRPWRVGRTQSPEFQANHGSKYLQCPPPQKITLNCVV